MLIVQAAALLSAMYALLLSRTRVEQTSRPQITYAPMSAMDVEKKKNLDKIYNCNDAECVNMLRMRRAPFFFIFATCLGKETCLGTSSIVVLKSKLQCFFMLWDITNALELSTKLRGGQLRQRAVISRRCCTQLVNLDKK
ncbi:hypothetical protein BS78_09G022000 [Paspalum vaginatum]|nr:hypothetical protein BS78_09G022000 [Paspalum vaginatum]